MNVNADAPHKPVPPNALGWWRLGVQAELALFRRPMLVLSALAIVLVPSLYAVFYISSFWDPYGHLDRLPAALVNADRGATRGSRTVNLGKTVVETFAQQPPFHFLSMPSAEDAEDALRRGEVYFAVIIPPDFSERALAGRQAEPANFTLRVAEGANYTSAILSKRFGSELAHMLNEKLNRERWAAVTGDAAEPTNVSVRAAVGRLREGAQKVHEGAQRVQEGSERLDDGLGQAADGSRRLNDGTGQMSDAAVKLADGMGKVADGVQEMRDRLPPAEKLQELADGSKAAVAGEEKLEAGIGELSAGEQRLDKGALQLQHAAAKISFLGGPLAAAVGQLEKGIAQLGTGLTQAGDGGRDLHDGLQKLDGGVQALTSGLMELETNLQMMSERLPSAEQRNQITNGAVELRVHGAELTNGLSRLLDGSHQLAAGSKELEAGSSEMAAGLDRLNAGFAEQLGDADAGGLAASVQLNIERTAPVPNNGTGLGPYFSALALWLGGIMMTFVFYFRRIIEPMRAAPRPAQWLAKFTVPMGLGLLQATVVVAVLRLGFGITFVQPWFTWLAAVLGSFAFVALVQLFVVVLGDAGRLLAVVLLILQLAAAGGIYPVELSGPFYMAIHPYLPLTALVKAFRATMFGAFDGAWTMPALQLALTGCGAAALAICLARWKYVPRETYGPAVEFS
jgi:putative membrane protein